MNDKEQITEQDIEDYLDGKDELSSIYTNSKGLKAPDHLEFKIKQMAREAEKQSSTRPVVKKNAWFMPLSIAATITIAVVMVTFLDSQKVSYDELIVKHENNDQTIAPQQTAKIDETLNSAAKVQRVSPPKSTMDVKPVQTEQVKIASKLNTSEPETTSTKQTPQQKTSQPSLPQVAQQDEEFVLPDHLKEMMQPTRAGTSNELLPEDVLRTWTIAQWRDQILMLRKTGNSELADKYVKEYPKYYPDQLLDLPE